MRENIKDEHLQWIRNVRIVQNLKYQYNSNETKLCSAMYFDYNVFIKQSTVKQN